MAGSAINPFVEQVSGDVHLESSVSLGSSTIVVDDSTPPYLQKGVALVIDSYTVQAEVRRIASVSGATITLASPLFYDHDAGDRITPVSGPISTSLWACTGDGTTDDHLGLQEGIVQTAAALLWLDGQGRDHRIGQPLMLAESHRLMGLNPRALPGFAPAESNNALAMMYNGARMTFTADPATNVITTSGTHNIPADDIGIVFQGTNLPAGLTAGKFYYARDRGTDTFKVSATSGGSEVDITTAGSGGIAYCEVYAANCHSNMIDCRWGGSLVAGINGILGSVQQSSLWMKVRVDACPGYAIKFKGQQLAAFELMTYYSGQGIVLDNMSFLYLYSYNCELCDKAVYVDTGGAASCLFSAVHLELTGGYSSGTSIGFDFDNTAINMTIDNVEQSGGGTFLKADAASANQTSYSVRNVQCNATTMIEDVNRGVSISVADCNGILQGIEAPILPSSQVYPDLFPLSYIGPGGRYITMAGQNDDQPQIRLRPGTGQTGDQIKAQDTSGNRVSGFNSSGVFFTQRNSAPADGDLVAGEMALWFDSTNGAAKMMVKAKQADGSVKTGSVSLA